MKTILKATLFAAMIGVSTAPLLAADAAAPAAAAPAAAFTTAGTDIGTLLDNAETKAVLDKLLPGLSTNEQIAMARPMTLRAVQQFAPDKITTEVLDQVDVELAKLKAK